MTNIEDPNKDDSLFAPAPRVRIRTVAGHEAVPYSDAPGAVVERLLKKPVFVHLFTDGPDRVFNADHLATYLGNTLGPNFTVQNHGDFTQFILSQKLQDREEVIRRFAMSKAATKGSIPLSVNEKMQLEQQSIDRDPAVPFREFARSQSLSERRERLIHNDYYETSALGAAFLYLLPESMRTPHDSRRDTVIVVTGRGIGNMESSYLGRPILHMRGGFSYGNVGVVSTTGLVDAPGKPVELGRAYQRGQQLGGGLPDFDRQEYNQIIFEAIRKNGNVLDPKLIEQTIQEMFADRMLHYDDPRLNEAIKGIVLSMSLFTLGEHGQAAQCSTSDLSLGEPDISKFCRLHDAHWQEELLATQIKQPDQPEFCDYHQTIFEKLKE